MHKYVLYCLIFLLLPALKAGAQDNYTERAKKYIDQYSSLAILEQQKNGIPASITLAQGILETEAGLSELATEANNHFGIKCKNGWSGETFNHSDDLPNECFKKYKCAQDSYRDHSEHLKNNPRYAPLFTYTQTDYASWAKCLKKCGYATNPQYASKLIKIIEDFGLQQYTYSALDSSLLNNYSENPVANALPYQDTVRKTTIAKTPEIPKPRQDVAVAKSRGDTTRRVTIISHDRHTVTEGETLATIAKAEGVDVKKIMELNMLYSNEEPVPGSILELQKPARQKPIVRMSAMSAHKGNAIIVSDDNAAALSGDYVEIRKTKPVERSESGQPAPPAIVQAPKPVAPVANTQPPKPATPPATVHARTPSPAVATVVNKPAPPSTVQPVVINIPPSVKPATTQKKQLNNPVVADENPDPKRDRELAALKAELDKVVYADDSKLIAENAPQPAPAKQQEPSSASSNKFYLVKKGDTAFGIAKKNNISIAQLKKWNNLDAGDIKIGQNLRVKE